MVRCFSGERCRHDPGVVELLAKLGAVGNRRSEHDGLAAFAELDPLTDHVTDNGAPALGCRLVRPLSVRCLGTGHVRRGAAKDAHGHQDALLRQFVHRCRVHEIREQLSEAGRERRSGKADNLCRTRLDVLHPGRIHGVRFINDDHIRLRPIAARQRLNACNLKRQAWVVERMIRLNHAMRR